MKQAKEPIIHVKRLDEGEKRTFDQQMQAIKGMSVDAFIQTLQRNDGGKYDRIFLSK